MVGRNRGFVTQQGEVLVDHLVRDGHDVVAVSSSRNRYVRLAIILWTLVRRQRQYDIVIVQTYSGLSFVVADLASAAARAVGRPVVFHLHGGALPEFIAARPRSARRVLKRAAAIVAPTAYLARAVASIGLSAAIIPNIIDPGAYPFRPRRSIRPRLFWMRSFHPIYNPAMALDVLERVRARYPEATLVMAGQDKGFLAVVQAEVKRRGMEPAVRFAGFLDHEGKLREGAAADVFITTSRVDNTPVAVLEACAMGLPVISTDVGGLRDLVQDGETALLVPDGDAKAMADAVHRLMTDSVLVERLSANGRRLAERCAWSEVRERWMRLLGAVAA